ncbi:MAG: transposase [Planctomycetota bacterium]
MAPRGRSTVFPDVPVRRWVLSLPHRVRWACAFDHRATQGVRKILVRALAGFYCTDARTRGIVNAKAGTVVSVQRFDSALRLNIHFHSLWPDGTFTCALRQPEATFHPARQITNQDLEGLVQKIRRRVLCYLRKTGKLTDLDTADHDVQDPSLFDTLRAAAIQGKAALGTRAGRIDPRLGQGSHVATDFTRGRLCANLDGFSLHAAVRVDGCNRDRLERLCRYALRPAIVHERLSLTPSGKVLYAFKRPWRDGSTHVVLDPLTLLERLAALIPAPRRKLVTHHGVFAPAFPLRHTVVPPPPEPDTQALVEQPDPHRACAHPASASAPVPLSTSGTAKAPPNKARPKPRPRYLWADLLRRTYLVDVRTCPTCKGRRRLLAFITERESIVRILRHLGLPTEPPVVAPPRPPPTLALPFS